MEEKKYIEIDFASLLKVLKRWWLVMLIVFFTVSSILYVVSIRTHVDEYSATSTVLVLRQGGSQAANANDATLSTMLLNDCAQIIKTEDHVLRPTVEKYFVVPEKPVSEMSETEKAAYDAEVSAMVKKIKSQIKVSASNAETHLLRITATSTIPNNARIIATAVSNTFADYFNGTVMSGTKVVDVIETAQTPKTISNPISLFKILLVGFAAAVVVYLVGLVIFIIDDRIDTEENVERTLGLTILGAIPYDGDKKYEKKYGSYYGYFGNREKSEGGQGK